MPTRPARVLYERTKAPSGFEDCAAFTCLTQDGPIGVVALRRALRASGTVRRDWLVFLPGQQQPVGRPAYTRAEAFLRLDYRARQSGMTKREPSRPVFADEPGTQAIAGLRVTGHHGEAALLAVTLIAERLDAMHRQRITSHPVLWDELAKIRTWCAAAISAQAIPESQESNTTEAGLHHQGGPYPTGRPSLSVVEQSQNSPGARNSS